MRTRSVLGGLALALGLALPAGAQAPEGTQRAYEDAGRAAHGHRGPWHHRHGQYRGHAGRPLISAALRLRQELGLSPAQVTSLEQLRADYQREAIRRSADIRLAAVDLRALLRPDPADPEKRADMGQVEAKIREIERLRADLQIGRIRALEQGRAVLTPEQREKLRARLAARWEHGRSHPRGMAPEAAPPQR